MRIGARTEDDPEDGSLEMSKEALNFEVLMKSLSAWFIGK